METNPAPNQTRKAAVGGLAVVGFVALILIGIATAIYAASYLPKAIGKLSTANVYLSGLVQPGSDTSGNTTNQLQAVVPSTPTYIPASPATSTLPIEQPVTNPTYTPPPATQPTYTPPAPTTPTYTKPTYTTPTYHVVQVPASQNYHGLPDLVTTITSVGYLSSNGNTNSFVAANTVPSGYQGAVRFVIANRGTNVSGSWNFQANLLGAGNSSTYTSNSEQSLNPNDSIVFTLGFDSTTRGSDTIRIQADANNRVNESNENNNVATQSIYLNGSTSNNNSSSSYDSNGNYCSYGTYYQNNRYYCNTSNNSNNNSNNSGSYDSNGYYCQYGTYYQTGHYYCNSSNSNNNNSNSNSSYDSNGNYCSYGTYYSNGQYYCDSSTNNNSSSNYDSNGNYCSYGTYYQNNRYYCN